ncbi:hypothetical protein BY458DRAFT_63401 [Sporodiniella umbellata]|nr:hypothetical protein BY458DRAFT_63401 [Sporodiniella umbellata]
MVCAGSSNDGIGVLFFFYCMVLFLATCIFIYSYQSINKLLFFFYLNLYKIYTPAISSLTAIVSSSRHRALVAINTKRSCFFGLFISDNVLFTWPLIGSH